ncbi:carboxylesterase family protein [Spirochaeta cellobiosiphila]|uniref:carboxylesterase family protein n=1 Tax=Spirochaeta cellobiosiphila TaxID=504483 RepID=UPI0004245135|nr:carboxylesterase family protein [Spirochaeta cellobiosiphila]
MKNKLILSMLFFLTMVFLVACQTIPTAKKNSYQQGVIQNTIYGKVKGTVSEDGQTLIYKGIPYGKASRWKAPQSPDKWEGILEVTEEAPVGIQYLWGQIIGQEDALNLDIYRPNNDEQNLPVFFYIHGGNNQTGTSGEFNGQYFATKSHSIVVSINYRLGLLGFNNLPALQTGDPGEDSGNYAILDMIRSLDWVHNNIEFFGGNPDNITLSGFSAGGRDVMALLISPLAKGKFQKAISISGGMTIADATKSSKVIAKALAPLVLEDGVKKSTEEASSWLLSKSPEVSEYLYSLSADRLAPLMSNASIRMSVFPHLYNDGYVIPKEGFNTEEYNSVPLIMLTGVTEFSLFARFDPYFNQKITTEDIINRTESGLEYLFVNNYGGKLYKLFNAQTSAEKMFDNYQAPIYTTTIEYGTDANLVGQEMAKVFGSFHGIWIPFLAQEASGFSGMYSDAFDNPGAKDLSQKLTNYVSNFMKNGNPNNSTLVQWNKWEDIDEGYSLLLNADSTESIIKMEAQKDSITKIIKEMEEDQSVSSENKQRLIHNVLNGRWFSYDLDQYFGSNSIWIGVQ